MGRNDPWPGKKPPASQAPPPGSRYADEEKKSAQRSEQADKDKLALHDRFKKNHGN